MNHTMPTFYLEQMEAKVALACDSTSFRFTASLDAVDTRILVHHVDFLTELLAKVCVQKGWHLQGQTLSNGEYHNKRYDDYCTAETVLRNRIDATTTKLFIRVIQLTEALEYQRNKDNTNP